MKSAHYAAVKMRGTKGAKKPSDPRKKEYIDEERKKNKKPDAKRARGAPLKRYIKAKSNI